MSTAPPPDPGADAPRPGHPTKLTDGLFRAFVDLLLRGAFRSAACRELGVSPATFRRWVRTGLAHADGLYGEFRRAVLAAEARAEDALVARVVSAASTDWRAAAWLLERKYPGRYGKYRGDLGEVVRQVKDLEKQLREADLRLAGIGPTGETPAAGDEGG